MLSRVSREVDSWRLRGFDMPLPNPATVGVLGG